MNLKDGVPPRVSRALQSILADFNIPLVMILTLLWSGWSQFFIWYQFIQFLYQLKVLLISMSILRCLNFRLSSKIQVFVQSFAFLYEY